MVVRVHLATEEEELPLHSPLPVSWHPGGHCSFFVERSKLDFSTLPSPPKQLTDHWSQAQLW